MNVGSLQKWLLVPHLNMPLAKLLITGQFL